MSATLANRQQAMRDAFADADIPTAPLDARVLMQNIVGFCDRDMIVFGKTHILSPQEMRQADEWQAARCAKKPTSRILGRREFYGNYFLVTPQVLDPRPDSEIVVDAALENIFSRGKVLDLGTGSGALLLAILARAPHWTGVGVDISPPALAIARANAKNLRLTHRSAFICGDWGHGLEGTFDMIVANPPYIAADEIPKLPPEVRAFDPPLALNGGADGLAAYRDLLPHAARLLAPHGKFFTEIGCRQAEQVAKLMQQTDLQVLDVRRDLAGRPRVIVGELKKFKKVKKRV